MRPEGDDVTPEGAYASSLDNKKSHPGRVLQNVGLWYVFVGRRKANLSEQFLAGKDQGIMQRRVKCHLEYFGNSFGG